MMVPPEYGVPTGNANASELNVATNAAPAQVNTAIQQQAGRGAVYSKISANQAQAAIANATKAGQNSEDTRSNKAAALLTGYVANMQKLAKVTEGKQHIAALANRYAQPGDGVEDISAAISQGLGLGSRKPVA